MKKRANKGFTLIELMIVVAIIGILAAIAIPKFADLISKSKEGATKGGLSTVRSSLQIYYGDNEGMFPNDNLDSLAVDAKYFNKMPDAKLPKTGKSDSDDTITYSSMSVAGAMVGVGGGSTNAGGWAYANDMTVNNQWGNFVVNCTELDLKGFSWTTY